MSSENIFTVGGPVQASDGLYLPRKADNELLALCRAGDFAYVLTPRQLGKSSLMFRTAEQLRTEGTRSVIIDLQGIGTKLTPEEWYVGLLSMVQEQLELDTDSVTWWEQYAHLGVTQRLTMFFEQVLIKEVAEPVVVFIDEIDTTLSLTFTDDFFAAIRYFYNARALSDDVRRLSFVLIGVATPGDLIRDPQRTPFNIGKRVDLGDFTLEEALPLTAGLNFTEDQARQVLGWVMKWTNGHPYLTQRLCRALCDQKKSEWTEAEVDALVGKTFFGRISEQDNNLQFVRDMLTKRAPDLSDVLHTYREVLRQTRRVFDEEQSIIKSHLKLSGVTRPNHGELFVRNPIYAEVFNEGWVAEHLPVNWYKRARKAGVPLVFTLLVFAASIAIVSAVKSRAEVSNARKQADEQRQSASLITQEANRKFEVAAERLKQSTDALKAANARLKEAEKKQSEILAAAEAAAAEAAEQRAAAESQKRLSDQQSIEAASNQAATKAELLRVGSPDLLPQSAFLALESMRLSPATATAFDAAKSLRSAVALLPKSTKLISGSRSVNHITFGPDGRYVATVTDEHVVRILDWTTGREIARMKHEGRLHSIEFSPDGKYLATAAGMVETSETGRERKVDSMARIWNASNGQLLFSLKHDDVVTRVAFCRTGKYLATASDDSTARVWDVATGKEVAQFKHDGPVRFLSFDANGSMLATGDTALISSRPLDSPGLPDSPRLPRSSARVWNIADGRELRRQTYDGRLNAVIFNPARISNFESPSNWILTAVEQTGPFQGRSIDQESTGFPVIMHPSFSVSTVTSTLDGALIALVDHAYLKDETVVLLWSVENRRELSRIIVNGKVEKIAFSPDGKYLATTAGKTANVWAVPSGEEVARMTHDSTVTSIAFNTDGDFVATSSYDGTARVWNVARLRNDFILSSLRNVMAVAFSPDGRLMATATQDATHVWEVATGSQLASLTTKETSRVFSVTFSPDAKYLALGTSSRVIIWDIQSFKQLGEIPSDTSIPKVAFTADGKFLLTASAAGLVQLWDVTRVEQPKESKRLPQMGSAIFSLAVSSNGRFFAVAASSGQMYVYSIETLKEVARLQASGNSIALSPDGAYVLTSGREIQVWQVSSQQVVFRLETEDRPFSGPVAFSPDGKHITGGGRVWELATSREVARFEWDRYGASGALAFSPNGKYLMTDSSRGLRLWLWNPQDLIDEACSRLPRNLNVNEWMEYFGDIKTYDTCRNLPVEPTFISRGRYLAAHDDPQGALAIFRRVSELQPDLKLNPENELRRSQATIEFARFLNQTMDLFGDNKMEEGVAAYKQAIAAYQRAAGLGEPPEVQNAEDILNLVCWEGSKRGYAAQVMDACERAVRAASDDQVWHYRDSRGLARALTGNWKGAIEDFEEYERKASPGPAREARTRWIRQLNETKRFSADELTELRAQQRGIFRPVLEP